MANRRLAASVFIRPDLQKGGLGNAAPIAAQEPLMRDLIVYLVCLHELGHALGLPDGQNDADLMWGGGHNNLAVYERQRSRVKARVSQFEELHYTTATP
jgi:hypothetical protein